MSRSVKKQPVWNDCQSPGTVWAKRQAAKAVRRFKYGVSNGRWYRKLYCSWNIHDYRFYRTKEQAIHKWEASQRTQWPDAFTLSEAIEDWNKSYRRK